MKEIAVESAKGILQNLIVVASLVHTLTDSFGSASDLYRKLKKERKVEESDDSRKGHRHVPVSRKRRDSDTDSDFRDRRRLGRSKSRKGERSKSTRRHRDRDDNDSDEDSINASSELVLAEYKKGYHYLGEKYALGDLIAQNQLQAQIINLQQTLLTIYQSPQHPHISQHLSHLLQTTRTARAASIEALAMQYRRMLEIPETFPLENLPGSLPPPTSGTHGLAIRSSPRTRTHSIDSGSNRTAHSKPSSHGTASRSLYCVYAHDLQKYPSQPLADACLTPGDGRCPFCKFAISTRPGKAWEVVKEDEKRRDRQRVFLVQLRFIVKCHREGGGFTCVVCSKYREADTVCGEARALVDHLWREHTCAELRGDGDIEEVG